MRFLYGNETVSGQKLRYEERRDEDGLRTRRYFDLLGRTVRSAQGYGTIDAAVTVVQYDMHDNLVSVTQPEGQVSTYTYDKLSRLTRKTTPDGGTLSVNIQSNST